MGKKVLVIGSGPAGLMAAHAAELYTSNIHIMGNPSASFIGGAQYLHRHIPDLTDELPEDMVSYRYFGTPEAYSQKVYGRPDAPVSWGKWEGDQPAWNLLEAYRKLWFSYGPFVEQRQLQPEDIYTMCSEYDLVINSAPRPAFCLHNHEFGRQVLFVRELQDMPAFSTYVLYNGEPDVEWARESCLWGRTYRESPWQFTPEVGVSVAKPTGHACTCHPFDNYLLVGRYGSWDKDKLTHHAYEEVERALQQM